MLNKIFLIIIFSLTVVSCKESETKKKKLKKADLNGYWEQQGEGEIIEINDSLVISYYSSKFNCYPNWKISREYFNTQTPTITLNIDESFTKKEGFTEYTYLKMKEEPSLCKELTEEQKNNNVYNFNTIWNTFNDQYAYFKERNIDWNYIKTKYKGQFTNETKPFEFYLLMEKMVLEIKDEHSDFEVPEEFDEQWQYLNKEKDTTDYQSLAKAKSLEKYVQNIKTYNNGQLIWGFISDNLSYIQINGMDGFANYGNGSEMSWDEYWKKAENSDNYLIDLIDGTNEITDSIVENIKSSKNCVIDLRFNGGGYDMVGLTFLSHFINKNYNVYKKKRRFENGFAGIQTIDIKSSKNNYSGNVYILTSSYTVSAAETTVLATMNFPNFKRIGSNTNGAFSDILYKKLPNGWTYWLSNEVYEGMNGKIYEAVGIPPNYKVQYPRNEKELFKFMNAEFENQDRAIEKVIDLTK